MTSNLFHKKEEVISKLNFIIGQKASILSTSIVKIFAANLNQQWEYTNVCGILCLVLDRSMDGALFLKVFHPKSFELVFECELYCNFSYKKFNSFFYYFQIHNGFIGLSFWDDKEPESLFKKIDQLGKKGKEDVLKKKWEKLFEKEEIKEVPHEKTSLRKS